MTPTDAPDLQTRLSQALAGQYRVERTLGQGGMGTVFLARDETLDRPVAIKVISPDVGTSAEIRQRFLQEARTVARLRHPNIVPVYAAGEAEGLLYFVMEYVPGESLRERMTAKKTLTADEAVPILSDLALALDYAHAAGIVHRDVKPENVLLDGETGRAMLMDFGVARALANDGRLTGTGFVLGSPRYMSPEQASGDDKLDGRSDLYSLGLIAYEMFTGAPCVDAPTAASVLVKHLTERPMPLANKTADVPDDVAAAVDKLLEKSPDARFQRGAAFVAALNGEAFDDRTPQGQTYRTGPLKRRSTRRKRRQMAITGGVLALVAAVGGGLWMQSRTKVNDKAWFVAPFEVQGPDRSLDWLREGSLNMLTLSLAQWKDLEVTEYERTLDLLHAEGLDDSRSVRLEEARRIARKVGAGRVVMGQITSINDSLIVTASLYDLSSDTKKDDARVAAVKGTDPRPLFESVATQLLDLVGAPKGITFELAKQTTTSVDAYRAYLDGLRHLNAWRLSTADSAFDVAIRHDSTFALAYYKKALAMGWIPSFDSTRRIASAKAVENSSRLPARERELVLGHDELTKALFASNRIPPDTAAARLGFLASRNRLAQVVAKDSNDAEAWYALADADFHLVYRNRFGEPDTAAKYLTESLRGFQRTIKLDSTFHLAFSHLVQIYAEAAQVFSPVVLTGDSLRPAGVQNERRIGTPEQVAALRSAARNRSREAAAGWVASDPDAIAARRELATAYLALRQPDSAISVLQQAMKQKDADRFFEWQVPLIKATNGLPSAGPEMQAIMNRYPADSVKKFSVGDRMRTIFSAVTVGGATGMPSLFDRASELVQRTDPVLPGDTVKSKFIMDYYTTGMRVGMGLPMSPSMRTMLTGAVRTFESSTRFRDISIPYMVYLETRDTVFSSAATRFSQNGLPEIAALTAIDRGDTTTATRLADQFPSLDSLRRGALGMNGMRLMARAEVMHALGRTRLATEIYESIDPARFSGVSNPEPGWPLYVRSFLMRGRLYEQLGERERAISSYQRFLALWKDAEAPLQPQLREARDALARLKESNAVPVKGSVKGGV